MQLLTIDSKNLFSFKVVKQNKVLRVVFEINKLALILLSHIINKNISFKFLRVPLEGFALDNPHVARDPPPYLSSPYCIPVHIDLRLQSPLLLRSLLEYDHSLSDYLIMDFLLIFFLAAVCFRFR